MSERTWRDRGVSSQEIFADGTPGEGIAGERSRLLRLRWVRNLLRTALLVAVDFGCVGLASGVAYLVWAFPVHRQPSGLYFDLWPLLGLFAFAYWLSGLYPGFGLGGVEILRRLTLATTTVFLLLAGLDFFLKAPQVYSRLSFAIAWLLAVLILPLGRFAFSSFTRRWRWWGEPCVVLGSGALTEHTVNSLEVARTLGLKPVETLRPGAASQEGDGTEGAPAPTDERLRELASSGVPVAILIDSRSHRWTPSEVEVLQLLFRHVLWIPEAGESPVEGVRVRNLGGIVGLEYVDQLLLPHNRWLKRAIDLALGSMLAVATLPLLLVCAGLVKVTSRGPVLFAQEREGLDGSLIRVWKLRTMYMDAGKRLEKAFRRTPALREEWERRFKLKNDPRVVPGVGSFLRRFSLDELPQLWQVPVGTLSLVGPRPFPLYHVDRMDPAIRKLRRRVRPGITGLWQVKVRGNGDLDEQQSHDAYYVRNWSLWLDFYIMGRTLGAVLSGRGAH